MAAMQLKTLSIRLEEWGANKGNYVGKIEFVSEFGEVSVNLDPALSQQVLAVCADSMTRATRELAEKLTANIFAGQAQLEAPPSEDLVL